MKRVGADWPLRNAVLLSVANALGGASAATIMAAGALIGRDLASHASFATLPISLLIAGVAAGTLPAGYLAGRFGRRASFVAGALCGLASSLVGWVALARDSFALFCAATFLAGLYGAVVQTYRFAAADGVSAALRPRAIAWVLGGGIAAGVIGPQVVRLTYDPSVASPFAGAFLVQAGLALMALGVLLAFQPRPAAEGPVEAARSSQDARPERRVLLPILLGVVSYAVMNVLMTTAPLAMVDCGFTPSAAALAVQWHILAMYAPSFVAGSLAARVGAARMAAAGFVVSLSAAGVFAAGLGSVHFVSGMVLLGLGWNLSFVGATSLLDTAIRGQDRTRLQSLNDFAIFGTMAVASFGGGGLLDRLSWTSLSVLAAPLLLASAAAAWIASRKAR
ncbi:MAG: MFS transporter [Alsobacter sp.]